MRIALQHDPLAGSGFFQSKWSQPGDLARRGAGSPDLAKLSLAVRPLQAMPGQDGETVEQALGRGVRARQVEDHTIRVEFARDDRLAINEEQVALRGTGLRVEVYPKREHHVIG